MRIDKEGGDAMAILVDRSLRAEPPEAPLGRRISLLQTLHAEPAAEEAHYTYSLSEEHNVFFVVGEADILTKTITRDEIVPVDSTEVEHRIVLRDQGAGEVMALVTIRQTIRASNTYRGRCVVTIVG